MNDERFEKLLKNWASKEKEAIPTLRPKQEMYQALKAKKRNVFFPVFARWVTVGAAAVVVAVVALFHPAVFQKPAQFEQAQEKQVVIGKAGGDDKASFAKEEAPVFADADDAREFLQEESVETEVAAPRGRAKNASHPMPQPSDDFSSGDLPAAAPPLPASAPAQLTEGLVASKKTIRSSETKTFSSQSAESPSVLSQPAEKEEFAAGSRRAVEPAGSTSMSSRTEPTRTVEDLFLADSEDERDVSSQVKLCRVDEKAKDAEELQIGTKTFLLKDDVWIDTEHSAQNKLFAIKRDSQAYDELLEAMPELQQYFEHCQRMIVNIGDYSIELAGDGKTTLTTEELQDLLPK